MLARSGTEVVLIGRDAHVAAIRAGGLFLDSVRFQENIRVEATTELAAVADADLVLLCVKSYDTARGGGRVKWRRISGATRLSPACKMASKMPESFRQ